MCFLKENIEQDLILAAIARIAYLIVELGMFFGNIGARDSLNQFHLTKAVFLSIFAEVILDDGAWGADNIYIYGQTFAGIQVKHQ